MSIVDLARAAEDLGIESLWVAEQTHIPLDSAPRDSAVVVTREFSETLDPFAALSAAAAVTSRIGLGTGICLVTQRDPIIMARQVATVDQLSRGRFIFGMGAGWIPREVENHGTPYALRWRVLRERVLAMKEIWTKEVSEFHGQYVNFDPIWCGPKPVQKPHPPLLMGGDGPRAIDTLLEVCDEWLPRAFASTVPLEDRVAEVNRRAAAAGRGPIPFTVSMGKTDLAALRPSQLERYEAMGAKRLLFRLPSSDEAEILPLLRNLAEVAKSFD
jgi:probable F420-dependent oxidoreductase